MFVEASNEYGVFEGPYPWLQDVPGTQLVEPYKVTNFVLSGTLVDGLCDGCYSYYWDIQPISLSPAAATDGVLGYEGELAYGDFKKQTLTFIATGTYQLSVLVVNSDFELISEYSTEIICRSLICF